MDFRESKWYLHECMIYEIWWSHKCHRKCSWSFDMEFKSFCENIQQCITWNTFDKFNDILFSIKMWLKLQCARKQEWWGVRWIMQRSYDPSVIRVCHKNELIRDYSYGICLSKPEVKWIQPRLVTWILEEIEFSFKTSNHRHG